MKVEKKKNGKKKKGSSFNLHPSTFDYDALTTHGRRKSPPARIVREDIAVKGGKRQKLQANSRDLAKNFSIAAWAVRRHLDYVAAFRFDCHTGDRGLDRDVEDLIHEQSERLACDRGGRCNREKLFRMLEVGRVLDNDMGMLRLRDGRTQLIESDLIRDPAKIEKADDHEWVDGVEVDYAGLPRRYSVHRRVGSGTQPERIVPAENFYLYGFFDRTASDQVRGISPIVTALNPLRDVYENLDYSLVKQKISQLFAIAMIRKSESQGLNQALPTAAELAAMESGDLESAQAEPPAPREFDLTGGPTVLDLDLDEDVKIVETATPGTDFETFNDIVIAVALKALDIPYSFFNERFTNYSGSRTAWLHYDRACIDKRNDQIEARKTWTTWTLQRSIADGLWLPPSGKTIADIKTQWIPIGMPWWKPSEEIVGDLKAIAGSLSNIQLVCQQRGTDFFENVDLNLEAIAYVRERAEKILGADNDFSLNWLADFAGSHPDADAKPEV